MRLSKSLLLPALASLVLAEPAKVYIIGDFDGRPSSSHYPTLSPEVARLVIAQRLQVSSYHSLEQVDEATLDHINTFSNKRPTLFSDDLYEEPSQLVFMVNGATEETSNILENTFGGITPDFAISSPPSFEANKQFAKDIEAQRLAAVDSSKTGGIVSFDYTQTLGNISPADAFADSVRSHKEIYPTLIAILFPKSAYNAKDSRKPYGTYELPSAHPRRQIQAEEPIVDTISSSVVVPGAAFSPAESTATSLPKVVPMCFSSMDLCTSSTNNCSGHGACYQKYAGTNGGSCFACGCVATIEKSNNGTRTTHWGGGACSKIDISSPFWLITSLTIVLVFLVSWGIGMLFSIGEEKLPGVIGAGVSGAKAR